MKNTDEIRRLLSGPQPDEVPSGPLVKLHAVCEGAATDVLQSVREIWATALWQLEPGRLSAEEWRMILPRWFLDRFDPEIKPDDRILRRAFQLHERMCPSEALTLKEWVRLLEPPARRWAWWSASVAAPHALEVTVTVDEPGANLEALSWVLLCSGAQLVESAH